MTSWLGGHPNIYMSPINEPLFFSSDIHNQRIQTWQDYIQLFSSTRLEHLAVGEASTTSLFSQRAVPDIEEQLPDARYIVMLRNPVEMAYSMYDQQRRNLHEDVDNFFQAWHLSSERRNGMLKPRGCKDSTQLDYQAWCLLGKQLERLYTRVSRERVLVLVLDDFKESPRGEYLKVLNFLEVPDDGRENFPVHNPASEWRSLKLGIAVRQISRAVVWAKDVARILPKRSLGVVRLIKQISTRKRSLPPMPIEVRSELESFFEEDIRLLEKSLLKREFPSWRQIRVKPR
jgi:hypothetical protein